ncbi:MAG: T9SS type A sorting domain-containing protein [Bacteroidales bacterium]|nr:T9SS type A sorting domain-containing protein [Bacteroidales bacterium]
MKKIITFSLMVLTNVYFLTGQNILWSKCYGGSYDEHAKSIQQTTDGGFVVAGISASTNGDVSGNHGNYDYWVLRLDAAGDTLWTKCYGGTDDDRAWAIQQTTDGGFVVAGYSQSTDGDVSGNHGSSDFWILRLDAAGDTLWTKCYGGSSWDEALAIQQTTDSGFIVACSSTSTDGDVSGNHGGKDYWVLRLDATGDTLWTKCYGGSDDDYVESIQQTTDSGFVVAGYSQSTDGDVSGNHGYEDSWILRLDAAGNILWTKCYGGSGWDEANAIQQTTDSGFVMAGWSGSTDGDVSGNHGGSDSWILRLDATGDTLWTKCYGGSGTDWVDAIRQTTDSGFVVAGGSTSTNGDVSGNYGSYDYWILRLDAAGDTLWTKCYGGSGGDEAYAIQQTIDGGFVVAGYSNSTDGNVSGNHGYNDSWILRLDNVTGIPTQQLPQAVDIYPNPAHNNLTISINNYAKGIPFGQLTINNLEILDIMGNIKTDYYGLCPHNEINIDIKSLPAGIYFVKVTTNTGMAVTKFVKE